MRLVFNLDGVICTPPKGIQFGVVTWIDKCKPIENAVEFMQWLYKKHEIISIFAYCLMNGRIIAYHVLLNYHIFALWRERYNI